MKLIKLISILALSLLIAGIGWASKSIGQERERENKIELLPSESFKVSYAKLEKSGRQPHLQYRIINTSSVNVSKMVVELISYDAKDNVLGRVAWVMQVDLNAESSTHGILAVRPTFTSASRLTLKFTPLMTEEEHPCNDSFCDGCTKDAKELCGGRGVNNYLCEIGTPCKCEFDCFPPKPE